MNRWRSQRYFASGRSCGIDATILRKAVDTAEITLNSGYDVPPILTLGHLSHLSGASYPFLREVIGRRSARHYNTFAIRKKGNRSEERRIISVPEPRLLNIQRWIASYILSKVVPHQASKAYAPRCTVADAARPHCGARWIVKVDVRNFFESISELLVYKVFIELGYQRLVAFELTRICTRPRVVPIADEPSHWKVVNRRGTPSAYDTNRVGYLPQGAPTSPMLSNLAVRQLDEVLEKLASEHCLTYTRYADDLTFSSHSESFCRSQAGQLINCVYAALGKLRLSPNTTKTSIISPSARKVVLGLLVDGESPRLTRQFRYQMRQHLYYLSRADIGPKAHAKNREFESVDGLRNHLYGLVAFAGQVDPVYADKCRAQLDAVHWEVRSGHDSRKNANEIEMRHNIATICAAKLA